MITNTKPVAIVAAILLATAFFARPAAADADLEAGKNLGYSCLGCHGIEGYRNAYPSYRVPMLGGQKATYIEIALRGYRDGTREHPTMTGQASSLSDADIVNVSAYLASMVEEPAGTESESPAFDKAQPCAACHGPGGISANALWPTLAGQHEDYIVHALKSYRDGTRKDPVMSAQAMLLEEQDLAQLAKYFASLDGLETTTPE